MPKISQYPAMTPLTGSEVFIGDQGLITSIATANTLGSYLQSACYGVDSGVANAYVVTTRLPFATPIGNPVLYFSPAHANTDASVINVNGRGNVAIVDSQGNPLTGGELAGPVFLYFTGAVWELLWVLPINKKRTLAEKAAGVIPVNYAYDPGWVQRYGALGGGVIDDSTAFANAALVSGTHPMMIPFVTGGYKITTPFSLPNNATMLGLGRPLLSASVNGLHICSASGVAGEITVEGILFLGTSSSTVPSTSFPGFSAANTGLLTLANCSNARIIDCEFSTFYNGVTCEGTSLVEIQRVKVANFQNTGVLLPDCTTYDVAYCDIGPCTQAGGVVAYGIQCSGDNAGGHISTMNSISFNRIHDIPSWDGIGSHDVSDLRVVGNNITNVRQGIDLGHLNATNIVANLTIAGNYIESTTTDTWGGAAAASGGITIVGFDATHRVAGATITGNTVRHFFATPGMAFTTQSQNIVVTNSDDVTVTGNNVVAVGSGGPNAGIYLNGTVNRVAVTGNTLQGQMSKGAIRLESVTADLIAIDGNVSKQDLVADSSIVVTNSTVAQISLGVNPCNSTTPYSEGGTTTMGNVSAQRTTNYSGTLTGCTTSPSAAIKYSINGDLVTLEIPAFTATSNTTSCTITGAPAEIRPVNTQTCVGATIDSSSLGISLMAMDATGVLTLSKGTSTTGFTNTGTKGVGACTITYRRSA